MGSMFDLTKRVAIVTGSGRGIGKAIALGLAQAGADVVVLARTAADIEKTASEIRALGQRALAIPTDVRVTDQIYHVVEATMKEFGWIDILVNNAGASFFTPTLQLSEGGWDALVRENLKTPFLVSKAVAPAMIKQGRGIIINISSTEGERSAATCAAYAAAKAGVINLTRAMAIELADKGILVNCVAPGSILTEATRKLFYGDSAVMSRRSADAISHIPMGRTGSPEEIANTILFLAAPESSYITGQTLCVDGGWSAGGFFRNF
jgi:NAD(P)-dependent dehydrogenase (short-subunit alcohol dehydrogenase family)